MKSRDSRLNTCRRFQTAFVFAAVLANCGCAHLATVKTTQPRVPAIAASEDKLSFAKQHLAAAERAQPLVALGHDLSAAKLSLHVLEQRPSDQAAQSVYNFSVARAVEIISSPNIRRWQPNVSVPVTQTSFL